MVSSAALFLASAVSLVAGADFGGAGKDACAKIGGKTWVSPKDVRACYTSFSVDEDAKSNVRYLSFMFQC